MILISSVGAKVGAPGNAGYTASKWGVLGYTKSLALELASLHINVNSLCPGHINTDLRDKWIDEQSELLGITPEEFRKQAYAQMASTVPPWKIWNGGGHCGCCHIPPFEAGGLYDRTGNQHLRRRLHDLRAKKEEGERADG